MMKKLIVLALIGMSLFLSGCTSINNMMNVAPTEISVMAVASLKEPLNKVKSDFEKNNNIKLDITYSSSQEITDDILQGELTDYLILSSQKNMDQLAAQSLINTATRTVLVTNTLVAVVSANSELATMDDLKTWKASQIVIGDPDTTSSGIYAVNTFESLGLNSDLSYKTTYEKNVRLLIDLVSKNDNYGGILFKSDAIGNDKLKIVYEFPIDSYDTINYPMAQTNQEEPIEACQTFETYLQSAEAQQVFQEYGFNPVQPAAPAPEVVE